MVPYIKSKHIQKLLCNVYVLKNTILKYKHVHENDKH